MAAFKFLEYIKPIWYFNLKPVLDKGYFPIQEEDHSEIKEDVGYQSALARKRDWAWNVFHAGYINTQAEGSLDFSTDPNISINDEYRFIRKNFSGAWSIYILILRLFSLHNPIAELRAFLKAGKVKRVQHHINPVKYPAYEDFNCGLLKNVPLVSIIIPTLNRYPYLKDVLRDLEEQSYKNFEVLVVDQSEPYTPEFYVGWKIRINQWRQDEKALWKARNDAILKSKGDYILLYDDDSRVAPNWIEQHLKALDFFNADISSGVSLSEVGDEIPAHYAYFRWSDQLDTGNVLIKRSVFEQVGLFDRQFEKQRMGDGEFGIRAYLAGFRNVSNPLAKRIHLKVAEGGLREMGYWDGWRPKSIFSPRPVPSVLYYFRKYFGNKATLLAILSTIIPSVIPYRFKKNKQLWVFAFLFVPLILPVVLIQVFVSWQKASEKIKQGAYIEFISPKDITPGE